MKRAMRCAAMAALVLCLGGVAEAAQPTGGGWNLTFSHPSVAKVFGAKNVIVVGAGQASAAATDALVAALKRSSPNLVVGSPTLGDITGLDDQAIVARCGWPQVERVVIVRVFGGETAVTTIYSKSGHVSAAFTGVRGEVLRIGSEQLGAGISLGQRDSVTKYRPSDLKSRRTAYSRRAIHLVNQLHVVTTEAGAFSPPTRLATKGRQGPVVGGEDFYDAIDDAKLAAEYRRNHALKWGLGVGGGAAFVLSGVGLMLGPMLAGDPTPSEQEGFLIGGGVLSVIGSVGILVGIVVDPDPCTPNERWALAARYNDGLRKELGLGVDDPAVRVSPIAVRDGAGVSVDGRF